MDRNLDPASAEAEHLRQVRVLEGERSRELVILFVEGAAGHEDSNLHGVSVAACGGYADRRQGVKHVSRLSSKDRHRWPSSMTLLDFGLLERRQAVAPESRPFNGLGNGAEMA